MLSWLSEKTKTKKSYIFWLLFGFIVQIVIGIFLIELLYVIWLVGSFIAIGHGMDEMHEDDDFPWVLWFPITWAFIVLFGFGYLVYLIFRKPIKLLVENVNKLNEFLDKNHTDET